MDSKATIVKDWLRHPGARIVKQAIRRSAIKAMKEYDSASNEKELIFIQVKRQILTQVIPEMLDQLTYEKEKGYFNWRKMFGIK